MKETNSPLAGEMSGHIFFKERWFGFDDGIYAAARLLEILSQDKRDAEHVFSAFPNDICTPEINIEVTDESKFRIIEALQRDVHWGDANLTTTALRPHWDPEGEFYAYYSVSSGPPCVEVMMLVAATPRKATPEQIAVFSAFGPPPPPPTPEQRAAFLAKVKQSVDSNGYCVIVVSEGVKNPDGKFLAEAGGKDAFGHAQLGGVGPVIAQLVKDKLGYKYHWAVSDYLQRSARHIASKTDAEQAYAVGKAADEARDAVKKALPKDAPKPGKFKVAEGEQAAAEAPAEKEGA